METQDRSFLHRLGTSVGTNHFLGVFVMVIFLVFVSPTLARFSGFLWLMDIALGVVLVLTILALANQRYVALTGIVLAAIGYSGQLLGLAESRPWLQAWTDGALVIFFILTSVMIFRYVLRTRRVTANTIWAALCVYVFIGLLWSFCYAIIMYLNPEAFLVPRDVLAGGQQPTVSDFIYYSFVTLTTVGYGDITPVSETARSLSALEAVTGQVYLTVLVARLVGMHIAFARQDAPAESPDPEK